MDATFKNPKTGKDIVIKDAIADAFLQQILTRPAEYDVIATLNLNGDYLSDALAAQVGGIGIAPGGNINYVTGHAVFEATHGTAPKYANQDKVNPGSVILSGEMMLRYMGWTEAADVIIHGMDKAIAAKTGDLRLRAPDGRRDGSEDERVRRWFDRRALTRSSPSPAAHFPLPLAHFPLSRLRTSPLPLAGEGWGEGKIGVKRSTREGKRALTLAPLPQAGEGIGSDRFVHESR